MTIVIQASVLHGARDLKTESRELPPPGPDEIQVAIKSTTLCGSDMHYYTHGANGDFKLRQPLSLGHESAGIVVEVGEGVSGFQIGDKVTLEVGQPCGDCEICRKGRYNLCAKMQFRSSAKSFPHYQGTLQDRINCRQSWCYKLPDSVALETAALVEPLAVAVHAVNRARLNLGSSVLVLGAGAVGLLTAAVARANGATSVAIADIVEDRVRFAVENGIATHGYVVPMKRGADTTEKIALAREIAAQIGDLEAGGQRLGLVDTTFECTGVESCVQTGIFATAPGGRLMFVGMGNPIQTLHIGAAALREVDLLGVFRYANSYPTAINLIAAGRIPAIDKMITHRVRGLQHAEDAFKLAEKPVDGDGRLVIKVAVVAE